MARSIEKKATSLAAKVAIGAVGVIVVAALFYWVVSFVASVVFTVIKVAILLVIVGFVVKLIFFRKD